MNYKNLFLQLSIVICFLQIQLSSASASLEVTENKSSSKFNLTKNFDINEKKIILPENLDNIKKSIKNLSPQDLDKLKNLIKGNDSKDSIESNKINQNSKEKIFVESTENQKINSNIDDKASTHNEEKLKVNPNVSNANDFESNKNNENFSNINVNSGENILIDDLSSKYCSYIFDTELHSSKEDHFIEDSNNFIINTEITNDGLTAPEKILIEKAPKIKEKILDVLDSRSIIKNDSYTLVKKDLIAYLDIPLGIKSYTLDGYSEIVNKPKHGQLIHKGSQIVYFMNRVDKLTLKNSISPIFDSFVVAKYSYNSAKEIKREETTVKIYFSIDPLFIKQWYIKNYGLDTYEVNTNNYNNGLYPRIGYEAPGKPGIDLNVLPSWKQNINGRGTSVVVYDTGVDPKNPDLINNIDLDSAIDLSGYLYPIDFTGSNSHGTRVAGIVGAEANNGIGIKGIAYGAKLIPIIPIVHDLHSLNNGLRYYVEPKQDFIYSNSTGAEAGMVDNFMNYDDAYDKSIVRNYLDHNTVINQAIGNYFAYWYNEYDEINVLHTFYSGCRYYNVACNFANTTSLGVYPFANGVAAVDSNGHHAYYSNASSDLIVSAFGGTRNEIQDGVPNYSRGILTTDVSGLKNGTTGVYCKLLAPSILKSFCDGSLIENNNGEYTSEMNGTSAATPMISAVVALIKQSNPKLTWADIRDILIKSSSHKKLVKYKPTTDSEGIWFTDGENFIVEDTSIVNGAGFEFSNLFGFGLIDASVAVNLAKQYNAGNLNDINDIYVEPLIISIPKFYLKAGKTVNDSLTQYKVLASKEGEVSSIVITFDKNLFSQFMDKDYSCDYFKLKNEGGYIYQNNYLSKECRLSDLSFLQLEVISPMGTKSILKSMGSVITNIFNVKNEWSIVSNAFYGEQISGEWTIKAYFSSGEKKILLISDDLKFEKTKNRSAKKVINSPIKLSIFSRVSGEK